MKIGKKDECNKFQIFLFVKQKKIAEGQNRKKHNTIYLNMETS